MYFWTLPKQVATSLLKWLLIHLRRHHKRWAQPIRIAKAWSRKYVRHCRLPLQREWLLLSSSVYLLISNIRSSSSLEQPHSVNHGTWVYLRRILQTGKSDKKLWNRLLLIKNNSRQNAWHIFKKNHLPILPNGNFKWDDTRRVCRFCNIPTPNMNQFGSHSMGKWFFLMFLK